MSEIRNHGIAKENIKNEVLISYAINEACAQQENVLLNTEWSGQNKLSFLFLLPKAKLLRRYLEHRATAAKIGTFASVVTTRIRGAVEIAFLV